MSAPPGRLSELAPSESLDSQWTDQNLSAAALQAVSGCAVT
jgi:hypothetical protein